MRAYWIIMLCISLIDLRGQRIAKIGFPSGAGSVTQDGITMHYFFDDPVSGTAGLEANTRMFVGFLDPVFSSFSTPVDEDRPEIFRVFPNPFSDHIFFRASLRDIVKYRLTDMQGRTVLQGKTADTLTAIPSGFLAPGIYILNLSNEWGHYTLYKLIK